MSKEQNKTKKKGIISLFFTAEVFGMALTLLCVLVLLRLIAGDLLFGSVGEKIGQFFLGVFGYFSFAVLTLCAFWGIQLLIGFKVENVKLKRFVKYFFLYAFFAGLIFQSALTPVTLSFEEYVNYCYGAGISYQTCTAGGVILGLFANFIANFLTPVGAYVLYSLLIVITTLVLTRRQLSSMIVNFERAEKGKKVKKERKSKEEPSVEEDGETFVTASAVKEEEPEFSAPKRAVIFGGGAFEKKSDAEKNSSSSQVKVLFGNQTFGRNAGIDLAYTTPVTNEKSYREKYDEDIERKTDFVRRPYETGAPKVNSPMGERESSIDIPLFNSGRERDMEIDVSGPEKDVYVFNRGGKTREPISPFERRVNSSNENATESSFARDSKEQNGSEGRFTSTPEDYNRDRFSSRAHGEVERPADGYTDFSRGYKEDAFTPKDNRAQNSTDFGDRTTVSFGDRTTARTSDGNFGETSNGNSDGNFTDRSFRDRNYNATERVNDGFSRSGDDFGAERNFAREDENAFGNGENSRTRSLDRQDGGFLSDERRTEREDFSAPPVNPLTRAMQESEDATPTRSTMESRRGDFGESRERTGFGEENASATQERSVSSLYNEDDENVYNGSYFDAEERNSKQKPLFARDRSHIVINGKTPGEKANSEGVNQTRAGVTANNAKEPIRGKQMTMDDLPAENQLINPIDNVPKNYKYAFPPLSLLKDYVIDEQTRQKNQEEQNKRAETIITLLNNANIEAKMEGIKCGPTITRFELSIPPTVSVKRINEKYEDLNYWIASEGKIRLLIPIQGTSRIGIEVPNSAPATVGLKTIVESREFKGAKQSSLSFCLGADIIGRPVILDIAKMPHLLVAGATGTGKSVFLNTLLVSLIYKYSPEELRIILVDPKVVEFSVFKGMPNLMFNEIFTDNAKVCSMLEWAVQEMEDRYQKLNGVLAKNIEEYNSFMEKKKGKKMPKILIIIDEFADLMASSSERKLMENKISRLAAKARAAGIHLIMATQRPSADIMEGSIKTNFTSRIAFKMSSNTDAMVIMGEAGADKLLGRGDVLYRTSNMPVAERAQGCFIDTSEIVEICNYVKEHNECYYDEFALEKILKGAQTEEETSIATDNSGGGAGADGNFKSDEELIKSAMRIAINANNLSISGLQRKLGVGYPKAGKLMDTLIERGYVSEQIDSKTRKIYMTKEQFEETFGEPL